MSSPVEQMAEYVKDNYTMQGVEVSTTGIGSMRLKMPYEMHDFHDFIDDLAGQFGAAVDLEQQSDGTDLIVYPDRKGFKPPKATPFRRTPWYVPVVATAVMVVAIMVTLYQVRQIWASDEPP